MYRRISVIVCGLMLVLAGCTPPGLSNNNQNKKIVKKGSTGKAEKKVQITPNVSSSGDTYRSVVNFKPSAARGDILYGVDNRLDINELQTGLMRLSKPTFPPSKYIFQEGQYLTSNTIESWLKHKSKSNPKGLNATLPKNYNSLSHKKKMTFLKQHPSYLSYVNEQDYLVQSGKNKLKLGGISLAISVPKIYSYQVTDKQGKIYSGQVQLNEKTAHAKAKQYAATILKRVRSLSKGALKNVPIVIGLYQEQTQNSLVPGDYFAKTVVSAGSSQIGSWKTVNESHVIFPDPNGGNAHKVDQNRFSHFRSSIQKFFPNYVDAIGIGFYQGNTLQHLKIEIPIKFYSETEVISFTQYVTGLLKQQNPFPKDLPIDVNITSTNGPEALIVKKPGSQQPFVHIYNK